MNPTAPIEPFHRLPGWELVAEGIADLKAGRVTPAAALVSMAWPRLSRAGLVDESLDARRLPEPEVQLYRMLRGQGGNAYGRYNGLRRRLGRFERALDHVRARGARDPNPGRNEYRP